MKTCDTAAQEPYATNATSCLICQVFLIYSLFSAMACPIRVLSILYRPIREQDDCMFLALGAEEAFLKNQRPREGTSQATM